jgi:uncharacterized protein YkwD
VSAPHKLTATALTILTCTAITGLAAAPVLASTAPSPRAHTARLQCTKDPTHATRRGRRATRACRTHAHKTHAPKVAKLRQPRAPRLHHTRLTATGSEPSAASTAQAATTAHAATIAAVLSTACQNTESTPEAGNIVLVRAAVLCLINRTRAENGEQPLRTNPQLEEAAEGHCQELIAEDYFAHVSPSGETPVDRIRDTGYIPNTNVGYVIGENLAWGTYQLSTPQAIVAAWIASPGHLANILETQYTETGIGITPAVPSSLAAGAPGATYAQEFGVIVE